MDRIQINGEWYVKENENLDVRYWEQNVEEKIIESRHIYYEVKRPFGETRSILIEARREFKRGTATLFGGDENYDEDYVVDITVGDVCDIYKKDFMLGIYENKPENIKQLEEEYGVLQQEVIAQIRQFVYVLIKKGW